MPRKARLSAPGIMLPIMAHGIEECNLFIEDDDRKMCLSLFKNGVTLDFIAQKVAEFYEISPSEPRKRSRLTKAASARKVFAYACREFLGYPVKVIGNNLGMTGLSASTCIKNGEPLAKTQEMANLFLNLRP
jgi:hypothetical protein